jgi:hypothetical protein
MFKKISLSLKLPGFIKSEKAKQLLPETIINEPLDAFSIFPNDNQYDQLFEIQDLAKKDNFSSITKILDKSFENNKYIGAGTYECEFYASALDEILDKSYGSIKETEQVIAKFASWHNADRDNPYASAYYARALHNHGFAYRGNDWIEEVTEEGKNKLLEYTSLARDVFENSDKKCYSNWLWRKAFLDIAVTDYDGIDDHTKRLLNALDSLPLSSDIYLTACRHLLPRWHGSYELLKQLMAYAYNETKDKCGDTIFLMLLDMLNYQEEGIDMWLIPSSEILKEVADNRAIMDDDHSLTVATAFYCWLEDHQKVVELMPQIKELNKSFWYYERDPQIAVATSYLLIN